MSIASLLFAEGIQLEKISVEDSMLKEATYVASQENSLETRSISLQDKLQRDVSFSAVPDPKGEVAISFRGLGFKNTNYVEDGIPLYRGVSGLVDTSFNMSHAAVTMNDGSGVSTLGVSSTGGEVDIKSIVPTKELEMKLKSSISNNDEFYQAYLGSSQENIYIQTDASYYHRTDYQLSDDFIPSPIQQKSKRINSDKQQQNFSLKSGIFVNDNLHLAAKLSITRSEYGMPPNAHTDLVAPVWDAYSRIDRKDLNTFNLYADYSINDLELSLRAYYDAYEDIYAIYNESTYESTSPLVTYDDSRLGTILKASLVSENIINTFIFQAEENEHIRLGGGFSKAQNQVNTFKLSYLNEFELNKFWTIESAISYNLAKEAKASDAAALNPSKDKKTFDAQMKAVYSDKQKSIYASIAKKSRMPSMFEMFTFFPWESANPDLNPERSMQYTTGYQYNFNKESNIDLSLYYYDISDLIINRSSTFINRENAKHYGAELRFTSRDIKNHSLGISYAYAHAKDSANETLELIPQHKIKIEDSIRLNQNLKAYMAYQFMSSRYSENTATYTDEQMQLPEYHLLEAQLSYKISESINSRFGIKNILDENYEWRYGYPAEGRSYYVSLEWQL